MLGAHTNWRHVNMASDRTNRDKNLVVEFVRKTMKSTTVYNTDILVSLETKSTTRRKSI